MSLGGGKASNVKLGQNFEPCYHEELMSLLVPLFWILLSQSLEVSPTLFLDEGAGIMLGEKMFPLFVIRKLGNMDTDA